MASPARSRSRSCAGALASAALAIATFAPVSIAQLVFGPPTPTPLPLGTVARFATGDVNGDGIDDLVVGHTGAPGMRLGDGSGAFGPETPIANTVRAAARSALSCRLNESGGSTCWPSAA